eukprot:3385462-Rhodomonas_salina.5
MMTSGGTGACLTQGQAGCSESDILPVPVVRLRFRTPPLFRLACESSGWLAWVAVCIACLALLKARVLARMTRFLQHKVPEKHSDVNLVAGNAGSAGNRERREGVRRHAPSSCRSGAPVASHLRGSC